MPCDLCFIFYIYPGGAFVVCGVVNVRPSEVRNVILSTHVEWEGLYVFHQIFMTPMGGFSSSGELLHIFDP